MCEMSLMVAEEGHEDKTGGSFPAVDLCIDSAQPSAKHDPGASRSWNILTSVCSHADAITGIHLGRGFCHWKSMAYVS